MTSKYQARVSFAGGPFEDAGEPQSTKRDAEEEAFSALSGVCGRTDWYIQEIFGDEDEEGN